MALSIEVTPFTYYSKKAVYITQKCTASSAVVLDKLS